VAEETVRIHFVPVDRVAEVPKGTTILDAAYTVGINTESLCGGRGICKKCRVRIPGFTGKPKPTELVAFTPEELAAGYRLACLWKVREALEVEVVPADDFATKAFVALHDWPEVTVAPGVHRFELTLPEPSLEDQRADARRLLDALPPGLTLHYDVIQKLSGVLRAARWRVTATVVGDTVVEVEKSHRRPPMGLAVDIGTTSVVGLLVNLITGTAVDVAAHSNSQGRHGAEVMSRMDFSVTPGGTETLQREVVEDINQIVAECCERSGVEAEDIYALTVVGNTTMMHLFLGLGPEQIGVAPFVGVVNEAVRVPAARLGLKVHPRAEVYVLPSIAGFVGADTVGAILATRLYATERTEMVLDIGTNGEIAVAHRGELWSASAPAGPAFEGGQIRHGMRATNGAIDSVRISEAGEVTYTVIGGGPPRGICGTALIDLCAELYRVGVLDEGGRLHTAEELAEEGASSAAQKVAAAVRDEAEERIFVFVPGADTATGEAIVVTQNDIRQYQLAKASIYAGAEILLKDIGITAEDLDAVYLAGTFGSHIDLHGALITALVPSVPLERLHYVGNAALEGARMALLNLDFRKEAEAFSRKVHHAELSARADFTDTFISSLSFAPEAFWRTLGPRPLGVEG
jgi:uncharacterized 2Fe-2S/4Fe-4S cluster protein (DUF4445 family)